MASRFLSELRRRLRQHGQPLDQYGQPEQMAIEMFVIDHFADHDWLDRIASITATEGQNLGTALPGRQEMKTDGSQS